MKTLRLATFLAAFALAPALPARAGSNFANQDSKHRVFALTASRYVPDYDKFEWLAGEGQATVTIDHLVVALAEQKLYVYHHTELLAWSNISSGRSGYETPTGDYVVSQKDPDHHSSLYENAPMPFFMRLSDAGLGLHAGYLPGYPASHGCVRLPLGMARELFQRVDPGTAVKITESSPAAAVAAGKDAPAPALTRL